MNLSRTAVILMGVWCTVACGCRGAFNFDSETRLDAAVAQECSATVACALGDLHCDVDEGVCVECLVDAHCSTPNPVCDQTRHRCVQCGPTRSCGEGLYCDQGSLMCLATCDDGHCRQGATGICTSEHSICRACQDDNDCAQKAGSAALICELTTGRCVQCLSNSDCAAPRPLCDGISGTCVQCLTGSDCPPSTLCDPVGWSCRHP